MNIPFFLHDEALTSRFVGESTAAGLLAGLAGCKKSGADAFTGEIAGTWRFTIAYDASSGLNLPWILLITLGADGGVDLFGASAGTYTLEDDGLRFGFPYEDRYRAVTHQFNFFCTLLASGRMGGELKDGNQRVGILEAVKVSELNLFDVEGTWDFSVTYNADSAGYRFNLPQLWEFSFTGSGEVWLGEKRKQTYDFDGLNLRFPCHYYVDSDTGSAKHVMFVGVMSDADHMSGYLYNDVGDALILGDFEAKRR